MVPGRPKAFFTVMLPHPKKWLIYAIFFFIKFQSGEGTDAICINKPFKLNKKKKKKKKNKPFKLNKKKMKTL